MLYVINNKKYNLGNALSLLLACEIFENNETIIMDGDILCGFKMFELLVKSKISNVVLVDEKLLSADSEEVKVVTDEYGIIKELGKKITDNKSIRGESVGMYRISKGKGKILSEALKLTVKINPKTEYEPVINSILNETLEF